MDKKQLLPISAVFLTYNEEENIAVSLEAVYGWVGEIFIVDSYSTDKTIEIARRYTDKIYYHNFQTHAEQWSWGFAHLPLSYKWCIGLDADQRPTPQLKEELSTIFKNGLPQEINGFYIKRRQIFLGRWIRFGGYYPKYMLKLFKVQYTSCNETDLLDHHFYVQGNTRKLNNDIIEENFKENNIHFWITKHRRYAQFSAYEGLHWRDNIARGPLKPYLFGNPDQKVIWCKSVYYLLPLYIRPFLYFLYRYFLRFGFLDGRAGLIFHFFQGFCYRLLVDIEITRLYCFEVMRASKEK